jgi:hypothetical protein
MLLKQISLIFSMSKSSARVRVSTKKCVPDESKLDISVISTPRLRNAPSRWAGSDNVRGVKHVAQESAFCRSRDMSYMINNITAA